MYNNFENYFLGEKLYSQIVSPVCKKYNLTYMEFTVLLFLANNPQFDTAKDIVKYRGLTKSHVSVSVRALENRKLVIGNYKDDDHRTIHLTITDSAQEILKDGRLAQQKFSQLLYTGLSKEDQEKLNQIIDIIGNNIHKNLDN